MADEATPTAPVEAPAVNPSCAPDVHAPSLTYAQTTAPLELMSDPMDTDVETSVPKKDEETAGKVATTEVNPPDGGEPTEVAEAPSGEAANGTTPAANGKNGKRKSVGGVPEHKNKKLNKKKSMPTLHLECQPGEHYWARLKGYPPWPAIICDEAMLPESLLASRPVSTSRADGSLRDDFKEGGKNAKERTFPIMFLATNEFAWMVNTALTPLEPEDTKEKPKTKMTKALQQAYQIASESHDLPYFKDVLAKWQKEQQEIAKEMAELEAKRQADAEAAAEKAAQDAADAEKAAEEGKKKKKAPRKSKGGDGDTEMDDAEAPKSSKKRKKDADSDGEGTKPKKTPKVTKINAPKTPNGEAAASTKKSTTKPKKKVSAPKVEEEEEEAKPELTEAEKIQQREKAILYLRHRLQKGFLSRDQAPQESEMSNMAEFFAQLESHDSLEPSIIRTTKIHKVLKAIVKLASIPREDEFNFKKRSAAMLEIWNKRMEADGEPAPPASATEPKSAAPVVEEEKVAETNGEAETAKVEEEPAKGEMEATEGAAEEKGAEAADQIEEKVEKDEEKVEAPAEALVETTDAEKVGNDAKDEAEVGDVSMQTAPEEPLAEESAAA